MHQVYKYLSKSHFVLTYNESKFHLHEAVKLACGFFEDLEYDKEEIVIPPQEGVSSSDMDEFFRVLHFVEPLLGKKETEITDASKVFYLAVYFQSKSVQNYIQKLYQTKEFDGEALIKEYNNLKGEITSELKKAVENRLCQWIFLHDKKQTHAILKNLESENCQSLVEALLHRWKKDASKKYVSKVLNANLPEEKVIWNEQEQMWKKTRIPNETGFGFGHGGDGGEGFNLSGFGGSSFGPGSFSSNSGKFNWFGGT